MSIRTEAVSVFDVPDSPDLAEVACRVQAAGMHVIMS